MDPALGWREVLGKRAIHEGTDCSRFPLAFQASTACTIAVHIYYLRYLQVSYITPVDKRARIPVLARILALRSPLFFRLDPPLTDP